MRTNIYSEEFTGDVELVREPIHDAVRFFLKSPPALRRTPRDNRSAVTFWFTQRDASKAAKAFRKAAELCDSLR